MPWKKYKTGKPSDDPKWVNTNCQQLTTVSHVAHLETANRILKDGRIKSGLIFDESKLRTERILVNWLSPNYWTHGSRYGSIVFVFDFKNLCKNSNYYWVEAMTIYTPHACRFLITTNNYDDELERYNPETDNGPWKYLSASDEYFWNGDFTLEFMVEKDLLMTKCIEIDFTDHHPKYCNFDHVTCPEKGLNASKGMMRFLSNIIANDLPIIKSHFSKGRHTVSAKQNLVNALDKLLYNASSKKFTGNIKSTDKTADTLAKAALNFRALNNLEEYKDIISMFKDFDEFRDVIIDLTAKKFGITDLSSLD